MAACHAPYALRAQHVEDYLALLAARGLAEASRARALAAISALPPRRPRERHAANPCEFVERPRPAAHKQNQARSISRPQATVLPAAARERSALHELLVCLLFFNGLRASEVAAADLEDLREHDGHRVLRIRGKGETEKNLRVPLNGPTVIALERWLAERRRIAGATPGAAPLLISAKTGRRLTRQAIYGLIGRLASARRSREGVVRHGVRGEGGQEQCRTAVPPGQVRLRRRRGESPCSAVRRPSSSRS